MGLSLDKGRHMGVGNVAGGPLIRRKSHMRLFWWDFRGISGQIRVDCLMSRLVAGLAGAGGAATGGRTRSDPDDDPLDEEPESEPEPLEPELELDPSEPEWPDPSPVPLLPEPDPEESEPEEFPLPVPVESEPLFPFEPFDPLELEDPFDEEESEPLP